MNHVSVAALRRAAATAGALACTVALCTACAGSSTGGTGTSTATGASGTGTGATTTTAAATTTGTSGSSGGSGSTASGGNGNNANSGLSTCLVRYLNGSVGASQGTAGSIYVDILFKNLDNHACTLKGYPGVSLGAGTPVTQVGLPANRSTQSSAPLVTLQPGGYAYAVLQIGDAGNYPPATCLPKATTYLQVYPPNTTNQLYIAYKSTACSGNVVTMYVQPVQPGSGPQ